MHTTYKVSSSSINVNIKEIMPSILKIIHIQYHQRSMSGKYEKKRKLYEAEKLG